jgi:OOP family OmpA-OmpF porin
MIARTWTLTLALALTAAMPATAGKDKDRIPDKIDACPEQAEDKDLFKDNDGCPDPDDDEDKVCDPIIGETGRLGEFTAVCKGVDKCPNQAEDIDAFEDEDGCPDLDNDKDGIADKFDKCPNDGEDMDAFEDADGCPELDNDKDGTADKDDKCPIDAEDVDGFEDTDGCPELDNDKDGIPDAQDKCPSEAEVKNGVEDEDGCPDVAEKPLAPVMHLPVGFETGTANIDYNGKIALDDIAKRLVAWNKLTVGIRVWEGRKAKVANPKLKAKEDSTLLATTETKANAIAKYLADKGVALERIQVKGEGAWETTTPEEKALAKPGAHKVVLEVISGLAPVAAPAAVEGAPAP